MPLLPLDDATDALCAYITEHADELPGYCLAFGDLLVRYGHSYPGHGDRSETAAESRAQLRETLDTVSIPQDTKSQP